MARFRRLEVLQAMIQSGLVPVFYHQDLEVAKRIAKAVAGGGAKVLEFTNRGEFAYTVFSELVKWGQEEIPELILGAGSVLDPGTAALYVNNGANFIVGPVLNPDVARVCNRRKIAYLPGCGSARRFPKPKNTGWRYARYFQEQKSEDRDL